MSFNVCFFHNGDESKPVAISHDFKGGTYSVGGSSHASLNITYNYSSFYTNKAFGLKGLHSVHDRSASEVVDILNVAIQRLGDEPPDVDYWKKTEGNARRALENLMAIAVMVRSIDRFAICKIS